MFSSLFGKSKKAKEEAPPSKSVIIETTSMLMEKEEDLEKRIKMLETKSRLAAQEAIDANKAGKKQAALVSLNKHKMYEKEIETNNAMILKLIMQRSTVETSNMNTETFNVMKQANEVVKQQQREWTPEKVADLTDEMHELMGNQAEITDMISAPMGSGMISAADLEAELAALEGPIAEPAAAAAVAPLPEFPAVPLHTPKVAVHTAPVSRSIDEELRMLEAAM